MSRLGCLCTLWQEGRVVILLNRCELSEEGAEESGNDEPGDDNEHRKGIGLSVGSG